VREALGEKMYSIAGIAFSGTYGSNDPVCGSITPLHDIFAPTGSLEYDFHIAGFPLAAFLNLSSETVKLPSWLLEYTDVGFVDYRRYGSVVAPGVYDGVIFYDTTAGISCR
jgi:hypothetical protein